MLKKRKAFTSQDSIEDLHVYSVSISTRCALDVEISVDSNDREA
jgi:hypothetical protein